MQSVKHTIKPVYDKDSKILILGTIPSPKSREIGFYYGHPQNRFWKVLSAVLNEKEPETIEDKKVFLLKNKIALWDVLASCDIRGADDSSIKNPIANDMNIILNQSQVKNIFTTGSTAFKLYNKYCYEKIQIKAVQMLSTSPANCRYSLETLIGNYSILKEYI